MVSKLMNAKSRNEYLSKFLSSKNVPQKASIFHMKIAKQAESRVFVELGYHPYQFQKLNFLFISKHSRPTQFRNHIINIEKKFSLVYQ